MGSISVWHDLVCVVIVFELFAHAYASLGAVLYVMSACAVVSCVIGARGFAWE